MRAKSSEPHSPSENPKNTYASALSLLLRAGLCATVGVGVISCGGDSTSSGGTETGSGATMTASASASNTGTASASNTAGTESSTGITGGMTGMTGMTGTGGSTVSPTTDGESSSTGGSTTGEPTTGEPTTTGDSTTTSSSTGGGLALPWTYIAAEDRGIRDDDYGLGAFQAPRKGYKHSGIDYSMPVGTELYAPCDGAYLAGYDGGYGQWVQVICPVPATIAGDATVFASLLFAHLDTTAVAETGVDPNNAGVVTRGQVLGGSGKSGNADIPGLNAHLHFEVALVGSELAGLQETHSSGKDDDTPAAMALRDKITTACLEPYGFGAKETSLSLGRRIDPFIFLTCLTADKPALTSPDDQTLHAWSDDYEALDFEVDVGLEP